ncbi:MAG TPA: hypothetical protein VE871_06315 [Longimicrobium sp.]|nr:hypothetical protein [Longimicrobium sp.]
MMRFSRTALLAALALTLGARAGAAQTIPSPYRHIETTHTVGAFAGYLITDPDVFLTDSTSAELGHQSAPVFGLRYGIRASGPLSIDVSAAVSPGERKLFGPSYNNDSTLVTAEDLGVTVPSTVVMGDLGLRFNVTGARTWNRLSPYVAANGGIVADIRGGFAEETAAELPSTALFRFGPTFAVGGALGTDWFPNQRTSLRLELQGRLWRMRTPSGLLSDRTEDLREWNPVVGLTVGGAIHF